MRGDPCYGSLRGMTTVTTILTATARRVRRGILARVLARGGGSAGAPDLTKLKHVPSSATYPLRRNLLEPVEELKAAQSREPVTRLAKLLGLNVWLVTGYDEARAVLSNTDAYSNNIRHLLGTKPREGAEGVGGLGMTDPPEHTRLRTILKPQFTRRKLATLEPLIDRTVTQTLDEMEAAGPQADLVRDFGFLIPFRVISELLGLGPIDFQRFHDLGAARFDVREGGGGSFGAATTSREYLIAEVTRQRAEPGPGLIGQLLADHGHEFDDVELGGVADGVLLGGYETSASSLVMSTYLLAGYPEAWELLRSGTDNEVANLIEELLRMMAPVQVAFPRFAREDHELYGKKVRQGDVVLVSILAANRDPDNTPNPHEFDPARTPNPHVTFGHGMHRCLGAELGRMELTAALRGLARRFPDLTLDLPPEEAEFRELSIVYGLESLPVRLWNEDRTA